MKNNKVVNDGKMGIFDTISMAMGFAIGSGVITMTGVAIGMTGRSVILSYILSALTFLIAIIPTMIMGSVYPTRSASYVYSKELLHPKIGGFYMYVYFLGRLTIAVFGISLAQYLSDLVPGINQVLVAVVALTFFYLINLLGTKAVARVQNVMFFTLIASLGLFIIAGMKKIDLIAYFRPEGFFINGFDGVWESASLLVFAVGGAGVLVDFGSKVRNPGKTIPFVIVGVTIIVAAAYAMLGMVAAGLLPYEQVAFKPLTNAAQAVFGWGSPMYIVFVCGGALLALATTLNSSFMWYTTAMLKGCREKWFPPRWVEYNKHKVPYRLCTIFYVFGLVPALVGMDITILSKTAVAMTTLMWMIPVFGLVNMPKRMPEKWNASMFAGLPQWSLWMIASVSFIIFGCQTWALLRGNPPIVNLIIAVYVSGVAVYLFYFKKDDVSQPQILVDKQTTAA